MDQFINNITLGGKALKGYFPTNYLKGKPYLFNVQEVTFIEMLYLAMLDSRGYVSAPFSFESKFLKYLFRNNTHFIAYKCLKEKCFVLVLKSFLNEHKNIPYSNIDLVQLN